MGSKSQSWLTWVMDELCFLSARRLVKLMVAREVSAREVLDAHLRQIELVNPKVNAIVTRCDDRARAVAQRLDDDLARGVPPGPLHGLPVAHKDTHRTAGLRTTWGSPIYADFVPAEDDLIIERIIRAGAVTIGKTNVPEFAAGSHTFNTIFGATGNPYDLRRSAGGSTGGGAAAVACGMQVFADGSDRGGSLRNPASFCNVVGLRPTPGRVPSRSAVDPFGVQSVEGAIARSADDLSLVMSAIARFDARAPLALEGDGSVFAPPLERDVTGLRVALSPRFGDLLVEREVEAAVITAGRLLEAAGAIVEEADPDLSDAEGVFRVIRALDFDVIFGELLDAHRSEMKASLVENIEAGRALTEAQITATLRVRGQLVARMASFFERYDLVVGPTSQVLPFSIDLEYPEAVAGRPTTDYLSWMASCYLISATGLPALSVPVAFSDSGLPIGVQLVGPARSERFLLEVADVIERASGAGARHPEIATPRAQEP